VHDEFLFDGFEQWRNIGFAKECVKSTFSVWPPRWRRASIRDGTSQLGLHQTFLLGNP
jgi:hypothetical protein